MLCTSIGWPHAAKAASPTPGPTAAPDCPAGRTGAEVDVAELFARYQCWLRRGEYRAALDALEHACEGVDDAACPFNRALVHHAWLAVPGELDRQHCSIARQNYASYLAQEPYEEQSEAARSALAELDRICPPEAAPPLAALQPAADVIPALRGPAPPPLPVRSPGESPAPPAERAPHTPPPRTLAWLLIGAGSASAVATTLAWLDMSRADSDLMQHVGADGSIYPSAEAQARDASRRRYRDLVWGFGSGAVVLIGAGATLLALEPVLPPFLGVSVSPGSAAVTYDRSF